MQRHALACRYGVFLAGVVLSALGIALITKAGLGTSAISSLAYVLTFVIPGISLGTFTLLVNLAALAAQILLLGREFRPVQLLQLPATVIFSAGIDLWTYLMRDWTVGAYPMGWIPLLAGCVILGLGVALEVLGDVLYLPCEGVVKAISRKSRAEFGTVKTLFDLSMVLSAILVSVFCLGHVSGLREGTIVAAATVGGISRFFREKLGSLLDRTTEEADPSEISVQS